MSEIGRCGTCQTKTCKNLSSVGYVWLNTQIKIADLKTGENLGPNQQGELCIKSPTMMLGYYKNPQETEDTFDKEGNCNLQNHIIKVLQQFSL